MTIIAALDENLPLNIVEESTCGITDEEALTRAGSNRKNKERLLTDYSQKRADVPGQHRYSGKRGFLVESESDSFHLPKSYQLPENYEQCSSSSMAVRSDDLLEASTHSISELRSRIQAEREDVRVQLIEFKLRRRGNKRPRLLGSTSSQKDDAVVRAYDIVLDELTGKRSVMEKKVAPVQQRNLLELQKCRRSTILRRNSSVVVGTTEGVEMNNVFSEMAAVVAGIKDAKEKSDKASIHKVSITQISKSASELSEETHRPLINTPKRLRRAPSKAALLDKEDKDKLLVDLWLQQDLEGDQLSPMKSAPKDRLPLKSASTLSTQLTNVSYHSESSSGDSGSNAGSSHESVGTFAQYNDHASVNSTNSASRPTMNSLNAFFANSDSASLGSCRSFASETVNMDDSNKNNHVVEIPRHSSLLFGCREEESDEEEDVDIVGDSDGNLSPDTVLADISQFSRRMKLKPSTEEEGDEEDSTSEQDESESAATVQQASDELTADVDSTENNISNSTVSPFNATESKESVTQTIEETLNRLPSGDEDSYSQIYEDSSTSENEEDESGEEAQSNLIVPLAEQQQELLLDQDDSSSCCPNDEETTSMSQIREDSSHRSPFERDPSDSEVEGDILIPHSSTVGAGLSQNRLGQVDTSDSSSPVVASTESKPSTLAEGERGENDGTHHRPFIEEGKSMASIVEGVPGRLTDQPIVFNQQARSTLVISENSTKEKEKFGLISGVCPQKKVQASHKRPAETEKQAPSEAHSSFSTKAGAILSNQRPHLEDDDNSSSHCLGDDKSEQTELESSFHCGWGETSLASILEEVEKPDDHLPIPEAIPDGRGKGLKFGESGEVSADKTSAATKDSPTDLVSGHTNKTNSDTQENKQATRRLRSKSLTDAAQLKQFRQINTQCQSSPSKSMGLKSFQRIYNSSDGVALQSNSEAVRSLPKAVGGNEGCVCEEAKEKKNTSEAVVSQSSTESGPESSLKKQLPFDQNTLDSPSTLEIVQVEAPPKIDEVDVNRDSATRVRAASDTALPACENNGGFKPTTEGKENCTIATKTHALSLSGPQSSCGSGTTNNDDKDGRDEASIAKPSPPSSRNILPQPISSTRETTDDNATNTDIANAEGESENNPAPPSRPRETKHHATQEDFHASDTVSKDQLSGTKPVLRKYLELLEKKNKRLRDVRERSGLIERPAKDALLATAHTRPRGKLISSKISSLGLK